MSISLKDGVNQWDDIAGDAFVNINQGRNTFSRPLSAFSHETNGVSIQLNAHGEHGYGWRIGIQSITFTSD